MTSEDCEGKTISYAAGKKCIRKVYEREFKFYEYYGMLVLRLELRVISDKCVPLINEYNSIAACDIDAVDLWCIKALEFSDSSFQNYHIEKYLFYPYKNRCIGLRPSYSVLYEKDLFLVPVKGFENLIKFQEIYNKEFTIVSNPIFPDPCQN